MGLDMYLTGKLYVSEHKWDDEGKESSPGLELAQKLVDSQFITQTFNGISSLEFRLMYWRKANAIHKYFVDYSECEDDCRPIEVSKDCLKALLERCNSILAKPSSAPEILPTQEGFFFGSTDYDRYYMEDIKYTAEKLTEILANISKLEAQHQYLDICYHASW
ncbi:MAG: hypothetical protein ABW041_00290 [Dehalococcoides mccartyi]|nr:hypothetical protein DMOBY_05960 [Dehalococcoides mccartyi]